MSKVVIGQEDCLVLNVYVPDNNNNNKNENNNNKNGNELLPVMFFIHGGAFFVGSGSKDLFGPERFLDYGVVSYSNIKMQYSGANLGRI
jgi:carboxylesterase type B